ncbi:MAG: hypothetical protein IKX35_06680, partial [Bacteroidales bacterium]|nr:hypothetical protein [Bacteroidales bacterium]
MAEKVPFFLLFINFFFIFPPDNQRYATFWKKSFAKVLRVSEKAVLLHPLSERMGEDRIGEREA